MYFFLPKFLNMHTRFELSLLAGALSEGLEAPFEWSGSSSESFVYTLSKLHDPATRQKNHAVLKDKLMSGRYLDLFNRMILIERPDLEKSLNKEGMVVSNGFTDDFECVLIILRLLKEHDNFVGKSEAEIFGILFPALREWIFGPDGTGQCYSGLNMMSSMKKTTDGHIPTIEEHQETMDDGSRTALTNGVLMMILACIWTPNYGNVVKALSSMFNPHPTARFCALFVAHLGRSLVTSGSNERKLPDFIPSLIRSSVDYSLGELEQGGFDVSSGCVSATYVADKLKLSGSHDEMYEGIFNMKTEEGKELKMPAVHFAFVVVKCLLEARSFQDVQLAVMKSCEGTYVWDTDSMGQCASALWVLSLADPSVFAKEVGAEVLESVGSFDPCSSDQLSDRLSELRERIKSGDCAETNFMEEGNDLSATLGSFRTFLSEGKSVSVAPRRMSSGYITSLNEFFSKRKE